MSDLSLSDCTCTICLNIFVQPVTLPCGHELCLPCFKQHVEQTSLACPLCRKRIASWARHGARNNTLVNQQKWAQIKEAWPEKVEKRLNCQEDTSFEEGDDFPPAHFSLAKPGEIREEYETELHKLEAERAEKQKRDEEASRRLIAQLQQEEATRLAELHEQQHQQQQQDAQLAVELSRELNEMDQMSPEACSSKKSEQRTPTFMEKFLKKASMVEQKAGDSGGLPSQSLSLWESSALEAVAPGGGTEAGAAATGSLGTLGAPDSGSDCQVVNSDGKVESDPMLLYVVGDEDSNGDAKVCRVVDVCESAKKLDETAMIAGVESHDSPMSELEPRSESASTAASSICGPDWSFCDVAKGSADIFMETPVKLSDKNEEIPAGDLLGQDMAMSSTSVSSAGEGAAGPSPPSLAHLNEASNDSISIEMVHFCPIRKSPRTAPRRVAGGKAQNPPLVVTIPKNLSASQGMGGLGWSGEEALAEASSPIMQRRLQELSAERQAQVAALSKSTSTVTEFNPQLCHSAAKPCAAKAKLSMQEVCLQKSFTASMISTEQSGNTENMPAFPVLPECDDSSTDGSECFIPVASDLETPPVQPPKPSTKTANHRKTKTSCSTQVDKASGKAHLLQVVMETRSGRSPAESPDVDSRTEGKPAGPAASAGMREGNSSICDTRCKKDSISETRKRLKKFVFRDSEKEDACSSRGSTGTDSVTREVMTLTEKDRCEENMELKDRDRAVKAENKENSREISDSLESDHDIPRKKLRSSSRSCSREGKIHQRQGPSQQECIAGKRKSPQRAEYSLTQNGKQPKRARHPKAKKVKGTTEYDPKVTGEVLQNSCPSASHGKLRQTTLKFTVKAENMDKDEFEDSSLPCRKVVLSHFARDNDSLHSEARRCKARHRGKVGQGRSSRSASIVSTTGSDRGDIFRSHSAGSGRLADSEAQKERWDFATDADYQAYMEEQDRILAQRLQENFNDEFKYNWNCIRRKGMPDEYQLRNASSGNKSSRLGNTEPGPSGVKQLARHKHRTGSRS